MSIIENPWILSPIVFGGLLLIVELGLRVRRATGEIDPDRQAMIASARDGLSVLLSLMLGFSLPAALAHYEARRQLVVEEANAIATVAQRAEMLPEPFRGSILESLRDYVEPRIEFARKPVNEPSTLASVERAKQLQAAMWEQTVKAGQQNLTVLIPFVGQSVGVLSDLVEERLAAQERRIPGAMWAILILIPILTCFMVGYGMRQRFPLSMMVVPLTVAIVLTLIAELDVPGTGLVRVSQQSIHRLDQDLRTQTIPGR